MQKSQKQFIKYKYDMLIFSTVAQKAGGAQELTWADLEQLKVSY